jgi:hypothetical protein
VRQGLAGTAEKGARSGILKIDDGFKALNSGSWPAQLDPNPRFANLDSSLRSSR